MSEEKQLLQPRQSHTMFCLGRSAERKKNDKKHTPHKQVTAAALYLDLEDLQQSEWGGGGGGVRIQTDNKIRLSS